MTRKDMVKSGALVTAVLEAYHYGGYVLTVCDNQGVDHDVYYQSDWDFPALASYCVSIDGRVKGFRGDDINKAVEYLDKICGEVYIIDELAASIINHDKE